MVYGVTVRVLFIVYCVELACVSLTIFWLFSGIETLHKAIDFLINAVDPSKWQTCLIDITVSSIRCTNCMVCFNNQDYTTEDNVCRTYNT